jgi:16S rRNA (guanine1516-N2)-methyltransferase
MKTIGVRLEDIDVKERDVFERLGLVPDPNSAWILSRHPSEPLCLRSDLYPKINPIFIDFDSTTMQKKRASLRGKHQLLNKAVPLKSNGDKLLDLTAGFGEDAFCLASQGFQVTALERNPILFALLKDAWSRFAKKNLVDPVVKNGRLEFVFVEAEIFLQEQKSSSYEIVYYDPMFKGSGKSALSSGRLQLLQTLLKQDSEPTLHLLDHAMRVARSRLVIKRALRANPIRSGVTHAFKGQAVRYDMYITSNFGLS